MKKLLLTLSMILGLNTTTLMAELTQTQLHATLGIVTNFILDDGITHNGTTYKTVTSPYTGRVWLDRNLGASQVCTSFDDALCYGDYYQWGRNADGHQESSSVTTNTQALDVNNAGADFIVSSPVNEFDWAYSVDANGSQRATNWAKGDGSSVCPVGFRVPTLAEIQAELTSPGSAGATDNMEAFDTFLKLPSGNTRNPFGNLAIDNSMGSLWTLAITEYSSHQLLFNQAYIAKFKSPRTFAIPIRCIKNTTPADIVPPVITITGATAVSVPLNDTYNDAGATAVDNVDGNLTATTTDTVDTSTLGDQTITYTATDSAGNVAKAVRTVSVVNPIVHNGTNYGTVTSPYTGKVWLDRNLGASQVCTSFNDTACYGDYYQWGRNFDGHQESNSSTTATQATDVTTVGHGDFITSNNTYSFDWAQSVDSTGTTRSINWSATDGSSVCPIGFRVPTRTELQAETTDNGVTDRDTAFSNFLKLPSAGYRNNFDGSMNVVGSWGSVWSSSASGPNASLLYFASGSADGSSSGTRAYGRSLRCLRD